MSDLYRCVVDTIFGGFLRGEPSLTARIAAFDGDLFAADEALVFTVPALYAFARAYCDAPAGSPLGDHRDGYLRFRRDLYSNPTNMLLTSHGGRVEIEHADRDHDRTTYRLVRCGTPAGRR
jgi:hypothetical protein